MEYNFETLLKSGFNKKPSKVLNIFWTGFIIYSASYAFSANTAVNVAVCQALQVFGFVLFVPASIMLIELKFDNNYLKILYILYCCWLLIVIFRGFSFEYNNLKSMLFDAQSGLFLYFVPLILLFPKNPVYLKKLFNVIAILGILFIIYDILFLDNLLDISYTNDYDKYTFEHFVKILSIPCGFILMTYIYHSNRRKFLAFLVIALSVAFAIIRARRGLLFMTLSTLVISYMLYLYVYAVKKKFLIILFSLFIGSFLVFYIIKVYYEDTYAIFSFFTERIDKDTRSGVEEYFYMDMNTQDWIIGKGINGQYYCPDIEVNDLTGYRDMIETDYLNIILKGGIISLSLLILIAIPAVIKGLFYSKNLLSKAAGIWILLWLISLYPATVYTFSLHHILVWISIGICYSRNIRNIPENTLIRVCL